MKWKKILEKGVNLKCKCGVPSNIQKCDCELKIEPYSIKMTIIDFNKEMCHDFWLDKKSVRKLTRYFKARFK